MDFVERFTAEGLTGRQGGRFKDWDKDRFRDGFKESLMFSGF